MKYFIFAGDHYYPVGGVEDFIGTVDSIDAIPALLMTMYDEWDWYQVGIINDKGILELIKTVELHFNDDTGRLERDEWEKGDEV